MAAQTGNLCVLRVIHNETNKLRSALCCVNRLPDGSVDNFVPMAILVDTDPFLEYTPADQSNELPLGPNIVPLRRK